MTTLLLATVRDRLPALVEDVTRTHETLIITRNGIPAAVMIAVDDYESIMETLALINDPIDRQRLEDIAPLVAERIRRASDPA